MRDKMMGAMIKLATCPGECDKSDICLICPHNQSADCVEQLKAEALTLIREYKVTKGTCISLGAVSNSLEARVTQIMHELGVPAHIKGYRYMRSAIMYVFADEHLAEAITKELYPRVAREHKTTSSRVERAIRHAIEIAWDRGDLDTLQKWFGFTTDSEKGKPTNSEFITLIADTLRLEMKQKEEK